MKWRNVLLPVAVLLGALLVLQFVLSLVVGILSLVWGIAVTVLTLLVVGALLYGGYRLLSRWRGEQSRSTPSSVDAGRPDATGTGRTGGVEAIKERYASGEISEAELERRLEREIDGERTDGIDRELRRDRE